MGIECPWPPHPERPVPDSRPNRTWIDPGREIGRSPAARYLGGLGPGSRRTVHQALASIAAIIAGGSPDPHHFRWERLTRERTIALRAQLKERFAPATANKMLSALRGTLRAARDMGLMQESVFQGAAGLEQIKPSRADRSTPVSTAILRNLFLACASDPSAAGRRDAALLAIFLCSGLRRSEAAGLDLADLDLAEGRLHIRGERPEYDRLIDLPAAARRAVADWLAVRPPGPGPLLLPVDRAGLIRFRRMTDQAIYDIIGRIAERAGHAGLTTRDLRRAYAISLIRAGRSVEEAQYMLGHASWFTTAAYRALAADRAASSYDLGRLPYRSRPKGASR